ncbi:MAG: hypothetical protein F6K17_39205 [Okeania sp. SIO3C4]|nr:hypothetical protein [Okeania sp. SIO3C4]
MEQLTTSHFSYQLSVISYQLSVPSVIGRLRKYGILFSLGLMDMAPRPRHPTLRFALKIDHFLSP